MGAWNWAGARRGLGGESGGGLLAWGLGEDARREEAETEARRRWPAAASGSRSFTTQDAARAGVRRRRLGRQGQREKDCYWAGLYPKAPMRISPGIGNSQKTKTKNKKSDTSWIRIGGLIVIRIRYGIRVLPGVSV